MPDCDNSAEIETVLNDMPVLGLAGCHAEKWKLMQVRRADQALYHHELTVSSLGSVCQSCTAPLQVRSKIEPSQSNRKFYISPASTK